jgi:hypothetical protein
VVSSAEFRLKGVPFDGDGQPSNSLSVVSTHTCPRGGDTHRGSVLTTAPTAQILAEADWLSRKHAHEERVAKWTTPHRERRERGEKHPVHDFLFEYYRFRPSWLERWHPGPDIILAGNAAREFLRWPEYHEVDGGVALNVSALETHRRESLAWMVNLLRLTSERPPQFACFGLHEWAMVYRQTPEEVRHNAWPLRFPPDELARIVEAQPIRCSHFDAFRFFTAPARPLNKLQPTRPTAPQLEQRGCLHANMDLYKWAFKFAPFTPGELTADCFALARDIREVDMRASPYDFQKLGYPPIRIETVEGRAEYEMHQRDFAARSQPLRVQLIALGTRLLAS